MSEIRYDLERRITPEQFADVLRDSGIRRPVDDLPRLAEMLRHANLTVTAWRGDELVGVARCLTDYSYCCYVSDLAVRTTLQRMGIGRALLDRVRESVGPRVMVHLFAAPAAAEYYGKVGFEKADNAWRVNRQV